MGGTSQGNSHHNKRKKAAAVLSHATSRVSTRNDSRASSSRAAQARRRGELQQVCGHSEMKKGWIHTVRTPVQGWKTIRLRTDTAGGRRKGRKKQAGQAPTWACGAEGCKRGVPAGTWCTPGPVLGQHRGQSEIQRAVTGGTAHNKSLCAVDVSRRNEESVETCVDKLHLILLK